MKKMQYSVSSQKLCNEAYPTLGLHTDFNQRNLFTELHLLTCMKGLSQYLWAIISRVRNWPYINAAMVKYSDSIYNISVILGCMHFPPATKKPQIQTFFYSIMIHWLWVNVWCYLRVCPLLATKCCPSLSPEWNSICWPQGLLSKTSWKVLHFEVRKLWKGS